jgi:hypothetical protein
MSLNLQLNGLEYAGIEKAGELLNGTTFLAGKTDGNKLTIDGARIGDDGISKDGVILNVLFRQTGTGGSCMITDAKVRNSGNVPILVKFGNNSGLSDIPKTFGLSQNYPNPFNPTTTIKYQLPTAVKVTIKIYDLLGKEVQTLVNGVQEAGYYNVDWKATNFASGIYFYKIEAGNFTDVKKMVLLK